MYIKVSNNLLEVRLLAKLNSSIQAVTDNLESQVIGNQAEVNYLETFRQLFLKYCNSWLIGTEEEQVVDVDSDVDASLLITIDARVFRNSCISK